MRPLILATALLLAAMLAVPAHAETNPDGGSGPRHKLTQALSFLMVEPMYTTIMDGDRPVGMLMIGIGLDIPDARLRGEADHAMPVLRDAFVRNLFNFSTTAVRPWAQPDVTVIADRLQAVTDRVLGRKGARVLLAQVAMRITK